MSAKRARPTTTKHNPHHVALPWNEVKASGTIFAPDTRVIGGKHLYTATFAIYNGKHPDGRYYDSVWMQLTIWGDLATQAQRDLIDKTRVKVYGRLHQTKSRDAGKFYTTILADWYELQENP